MYKNLELIPLLNEKTYDLSKQKNVYVFDVPTDSSKLAIGEAVKRQFSVEVVSVNTLNQKGKTKRIISLTGSRMVNRDGRRNNTKKAYVTLKEGSKLPFFDAIDAEDEKREKTQVKIDAAVKKQADKSVKTSKRGILRKKQGDK